MQALQEHLSRWMMGDALAAMALGLGRLASEWTTIHDHLVASATTAMVFLVIYPMMVGLKFEALLKVDPVRSADRSCMAASRLSDRDAPRLVR